MTVIFLPDLGIQTRSAILNRKVNLLASSVHFGREPNRKRVCGSLNRTRQNHYGSEPNRTKPNR